VKPALADRGAYRFFEALTREIALVLDERRRRLLEPRPLLEGACDRFFDIDGSGRSPA
jgi:hypothetical protein